MPSVFRLEVLKVEAVYSTATFPSDVVWEALVELKLNMWSKDWKPQCKTGWVLNQSQVSHESEVSEPSCGC